MLSLDHIAVLGQTLEVAAAHTEAQLGRALGAGGQHVHFGTHNRLTGLGAGLYIEAIAIDPSAPPLGYARWFGLDKFSGPPRLDKWICRVEDLDAAIDRLPMAGRRVDLHRGALRWSMAVPTDGQLPYDGMFPALIQWHSDTPPGAVLPAQGLTLQRLVVRHPQATELAALLGPMLDDTRITFEVAARAGLSAEMDDNGVALCLE